MDSSTSPEDNENVKSNELLSEPESEELEEACAHNLSPSKFTSHSLTVSKRTSAMQSDLSDTFIMESSDDEVPEGRITPSIEKAIRRSIFNLSHHAIDSDEDDNVEKDENQEDETAQNRSSHDCCK